MRSAAWAAVLVALLLAAVKTVAYVLSGSVALLASAIDSAVDCLASAGNLFAIGHALTPADRQHRFGHGKAEPLAGLAQSVFIAASTAFLLYESVSRLAAPRPLAYGGLATGVMLVSIGASLALVLYQRQVVQRTRSVAIAADRLHYAGDVLSNAGVILGIALSVWFGWLLADPLIGIAVAAVLALSAWRVFMQAVDQLMDREFAEADRERIKAAVLQDPRVRGLHDLRTRSAGTTRFIQLHIELDPAMNLTEAHAVGDALEAELLKLLPGADILIHVDPHGMERPPSALARS